MHVVVRGIPLVALLALLPVSAVAEAVIGFATPTATATGVFMQPQTVATPLTVRLTAEGTL